MVLVLLDEDYERVERESLGFSNVLKLELTDKQAEKLAEQIMEKLK